MNMLCEALPIGLADVSGPRGLLQGGFELGVEPENFEGLLSARFVGCLFRLKAFGVPRAPKKKTHRLGIDKAFAGR